MPSSRTNQLHNLRLIHLFVFATLLVAEAYAGAQDYTITKLPSLALPVAMNSSGQVTGFYDSNQQQAFLWSRTAGLQLLGSLGGGTSSAAAINDSGYVVGQSALANGSIHAFLWTPTGGMQDLGSPQGGNSFATAINAAGEVIGESYPNGTTPHAFFWSPSTGAVDLGVTNGNSQSYAQAINSSGEVVGYEYGQGISAFRWTQAGGIQVLPASGNFYASAYAINDLGQIVGYAGDHAALWSPDGSLQDLGALSGDTTSAALFINGAGHIAGYSKPRACCGANRTFFWTETTGLSDIGQLPNHQGVRSNPAGLNQRDQIVGTNGATFLWSPTIGMVQVKGVAKALDRAFNNAGQLLGYAGQNVVLATPTMHVSLISSQNPSVPGQNVNFTASVGAIVGLPPDGEQVTFQDGKKILGTVMLSGGVASFSTSSLAVGKHSITANYSGDNNYIPSKSAKLVQVVNK